MPKELQNICQKYKFTKFPYKMLLDYQNKKNEKQRNDEELNENEKDSIEIEMENEEEELQNNNNTNIQEDNN